MQLKKHNLVTFFFIFLLVIFVYYFINIFSYFNPLSFCYISIQGNVTGGNEETIHKAISLIRKQDRIAYKNICKNVKTINEQNCIGSVGQVDSDTFRTAWQKDGCFIKGSKTIYLKPIKEDNAEIISARVETIKKLSEMSKQYWEQK